MFVANMTKGGRGFIAGIRNPDASHVSENYEIVPLGDERSKEFYSEKAAQQLSERHADIANRLGVDSLIHAKRV